MDTDPLTFVNPEIELVTSATPGPPIAFTAATKSTGIAQPTGTLRVGIHPVFQISLCDRVGQFLTAYPNLNIEIAHTNLPATLLDEGLDVVLRVGSVTNASFVARELGVTELMACASPAYLSAHGRPLHPQNLAGHRAIIPGRLDEEPFTPWTFSKGSTSETVKVPVSVVLREGVGLGVTAAGGVGIVRLYDIAAGPFIEEGSLERVLPDWTSGHQPVYAVTPSRRRVPAKVRAFVEFARSLMILSAPS